MKELEIKYRHEDYRELFSVMIDSLRCEDTAVGITNDGILLYIESKLANNSSAYWVQSTFYSIDKDEFCSLLDEAGSNGFIEKAIKNGQTTEEELKKLGEKMKINKEQWKWTREPKEFSISEDKIEIITNPHTDLWQRTYYHFRNDNAPVLQMTTSEKFFSFTVKTEFESKVRFDQCGVVMYLDSENWLKGSVEYENDEFQHLGSVATNNGYSDWATTEIAAGIKSMWYRFSRREDDYCIECSEDGIKFKQMRICHMYKAADEIQFGIYACSPEDSSFKSTFTNMEITECKWLAHDGQAPDEE